MNDWKRNEEACPFLPPVSSPIRAVGMKRFGKIRDVSFYFGALECAQSLWLQGLPAQAMLQLNRAFAADLKGDESLLEDWPLPYRAMRWIMANRPADQFVGNPRRHFQHLATRMVEPRKEIRAWRAWACWWHACKIFPDYPADEKQISEEGITEPSKSEIEEGLRANGLTGEVLLWLESTTRPTQG